MPQVQRPPLEKCLVEPEYHYEKGLRKVIPYSYTFMTYAKERWLKRTIEEVFCTEFRDRSSAYYKWAFKSGTVLVNKKSVSGDYVIRNGDLIENIMHRHEPPVVGQPIKILFRDDESGFLVVEKPGSIPVHSTGRYQHNTLLSILKHDLNLKLLHTSNRLDRLTSGVMICTTRTEATKKVSTLFTQEKVSKEYVCRVKGHFPDEYTCDEPLLTIDRQIGVNVVHPEGRPSTTIFRRLSYHTGTHTSAVHCRPLTGRSHQIRVHLQYIGYPIANDPVYNNEDAWGMDMGKGGIFQDYNPPKAEEVKVKEKETKEQRQAKQSSGEARTNHIYIRPDGTELAPGSDVPLSDTAAVVITSLREVREKDEQFVRDRDADPESNMGFKPLNGKESDIVTDGDGNNYCKTCGIPILPDPKPEQLYIWLHATRYFSEEWDFKSNLPSWACDDWEPREGEIEAIKNSRRPKSSI